MTEIGKEFRKIVLDKTSEKCRGIISKHLRNIIPLREKYNCNIYYLTSSISHKPSGGFWNFSEKQISELKGSKSNREFVIVFLTASDQGYLLYSNEIDLYVKDLPVVEGYYKVKESGLRLTAHLFRTIDEFVYLLSIFRIKNE